MSNKMNATLMTWVKYLLWTAIAGIVQWVSVTFTTWHLPVWSIPLIASVLKSIATYVTTEQQEHPCPVK
jgi:hypothetical protein